VTGQLQPPLLSPDQASTLLEQVIYEQVVACVDLDALYQLEQSLILQLGELAGVSDDQVPQLAKAMLDRALLRLPDDVRRYLQAVDWPFGSAELGDDGPDASRARVPRTRLSG
jgi:hypothetical protein